MRDGALPAIVLCLALGLLLARSTGRDWLLASLSAAAAAVGVSAFVPPSAWQTPIITACWAGTLLFSAGVLLARPVATRLALAAGVLAGLLTGALTAEAGRPGVLAAALPCLAIRLPAALLVARRHGIVLKVLASWLAAIALLSAGLTLAAGANAGADHVE